ncbi:ABC transporter ATP-binding protein [Salinimonas sediminis]|uniref:ABC transporter ATP-binding protein n=1 Tax=Salinimonas sediminis TaxID=2303538 RepID=A0A346NP85_9ALTE|nr:ABC transporter ATP-binding protein [Salinimonas sediminis]AXR07342.1 ABC transporter ATP-binding protein [Salinimonas sediminis]
MLDNIKALFSMLNKQQKRRIYILQVLFLISAIAQIATIGSIAPFIALISTPEILETSEAFATVYALSPAESYYEFLIFYSALVCVVIFFGNLLSAVVLWFSYRVTVDTGAQLQRRLFNQYMSNQFIYFMKNSGSHMISKIGNQIPRMIYMVLQPLMQLISQFFIVSLIILTLFVVDPVLSIITAIIVSAVYVVIFFTVRKKTVEAGEITTYVNQKKLEILQESIKGIRDVKLLHVEKWYEEQLDDTTRMGLRANSYVALAGDLPRFIVETIIFLAIVGLALFLLITEGSNTSIVQTLSFYAMAGYKILPAAQTIYKSLTMLRTHGKVVNRVRDEFIDAAKDAVPDSELNSSLSGERLPFKQRFEMNNVVYAYPGEAQPAIKDLTMTIEANSLVAFVGASGAGKSTIANLVCGLISHKQGEILLDGQPLTNDNVKAWQRNIGYVPQNVFLINESVAKNITFGIPDDEIDLERVKSAAQKANIDGFIEGLSDGYDTVVGENGDLLSGGQKQRLAIARALYKNPSVLIMDEATSALDNITERNILAEIRKLSKSMTVIMIAHRLSTVEHCDNIFILADGNITEQGTYNQLLESSAYFKELVYGKEEDAQQA